MTAFSQKPRVMIESPFRGFDFAEEYLELCIKNSLANGEAPFAMHGFYPRWLNDGATDERELGIACGLSWLLAADLVAFYIDHGLSPGMHQALNLCKTRSIPHEYRKLELKNG